MATEIIEVFATPKEVVEVLTAGPQGVQGIQGPAGNISGPAGGDLTGTYPNPTLGSDVVTNAKLANVVSQSIKGRVSIATGDPEDLTASQVRSILNVADGAEVNVQSNWTEASSGSDAFILNKPTLGTAAAAATTDFAAAVHTHPASAISDSTTAGRAILTAATALAQRQALDLSESAANLASFPPTGELLKSYLALDTRKTYVWSGIAYVEISPNTHTRNGAGNINVGETALASPFLSGGGNSAVGDFALGFNTTGVNNSAVGLSALNNNIAGSSNSAFGVGALLNNNASGNVAVGADALVSNISGVSNSAVGNNALQSNTANFNVAVGSGAGASVNTGSSNTIVGTGADVDAGARTDCVVIGRSAASPATNGSLSIGHAMTNLVSATSGGTSANKDLIIYLNGVRYLIALKQ